MTNYKLHPEALASIKALGATITTASGEEWLYFPHWMKQTGPDTVAVIGFEYLPEELKAEIKKAPQPLDKMLSERIEAGMMEQAMSHVKHLDEKALNGTLFNSIFPLSEQRVFPPWKPGDNNEVEPK